MKLNEKDLEYFTKILLREHPSLTQDQILASQPEDFNPDHEMSYMLLLWKNRAKKVLL